jgi:hypothetical protein
MGALSSKFLEYLKYEEGYKQPFLTLAINNNLKELTLYDTNEYHIRVSVISEYWKFQSADFP